MTIEGKEFKNPRIQEFKNVSPLSHS